MKKPSRTFWLLALTATTFLAVALVQTRARAAAAVTLGLETVVPAGILVEPVDIANAGDGRLFVVERAGTIRIVEPDGTVRPTPFLSITDRVLDGFTEQGLLGLVFHPDYEQNGFFYVNYTAQPDGATHIARFQVNATDPNIADLGSESILLAVAQPAVNHNAGDLAFGPDGFLYIPLGDGGSANDPHNNAQDLASLLGTVLRIDVDGAAPYAIPPDNPFVGQDGARGEIWAWGLRNPWRISFDRGTGDLYIGDVGQYDWEELNWQPAASTGGENYGWSCYEGSHANGGTSVPTCPPYENFTPPIFDYSHANGNCSVVGGFVYRGQRYPRMVGHYMAVDYCTGFFYDLAREVGGWQVTRHENLARRGLATLGEGSDGELYVANRITGGLSHIIQTNNNTTYLPFLISQ